LQWLLAVLLYFIFNLLILDFLLSCNSSLHRTRGSSITVVGSTVVGSTVVGSTVVGSTLIGMTNLVITLLEVAHILIVEGKLHSQFGK
jgi:hypothetical protein